MSEPDSDSDYQDVVDTTNDEQQVDTDSVSVGPRTNSNGIIVRRQDKSWRELRRFPNAFEFRKSDIFNLLEKDFTKRKTRDFKYADVEEYACKFSRRTGFLPCPWNLRVLFLSHNSEVVVESIEGIDNHTHEEDPNFIEEASNNFRWSDDMEKVIEENLKTHNTKPNWIKRALKEANVCGRNFPTQTQLYNKIAALKKKNFPSSKVLNTHELRQKIAQMLEKPSSEIKAFVPHYVIDDEDETENPRFTVLFSTLKNMAKMKDDRVLQTDATYRLNWHGFPVFVVGKIHFCYLCTKQNL